MAGVHCGDAVYVQLPGQEAVADKREGVQKQKKYHQSVLLKEQAQKHHTHWNLTIKTILNLIMKLGSILILKVSLKKASLFNQLTPPRSPRISGLKSQIMKPTFLS